MTAERIPVKLITKVDPQDDVLKINALKAITMARAENLPMVLVNLGSGEVTFPHPSSVSDVGHCISLKSGSVSV